MTLLAAFQALLARYTGQDDIVVGTPIAGRSHRELEALIGFFVNTLVLRSRRERQSRRSENCCERVRHVCQEAYAHQDLPFEMLVEALQPQRDLSREALIQVMFALQNTPLQIGARLSAHLTVSPVEAPSGATRFDLEVLRSGRRLPTVADVLLQHRHFRTDHHRASRRSFRTLVAGGGCQSRSGGVAGAVAERYRT